MIYSVGYMNITLSDLKTFSESSDAVVVDIRYQPYSKMRVFWNKDYLSSIFGERYIHIKELGNVNYKSKDIKIYNINSGLEQLGSIMDKNIILFCSCKDYNKCHRKNISEAIADRFSVDVEEIDILS
jgi:uncharacterized protein (DUF488 family)